jgi:hypothetical protein
MFTTRHGYKPMGKARKIQVILKSRTKLPGSFTFTKIFHVIWAHFRPFVPETGLCGVPPGKPIGLPLQSPRFVHAGFFGDVGNVSNDRTVNVKLQPPPLGLSIRPVMRHFKM